MDVAIVDSGCANVASVVFALERLGARAFATRDEADIRAAPRVIFPGVGAAGTAMARLRETGLDTVIPALGQPLLGICLGMQIMHEGSAEGDVDCLGIFPGRAQPIARAPGRRVPHMGWNSLTIRATGDPLIAGLDDGAYVYFVHGYALPVGANTVATCDYGGPFDAIVRRGNFWGCQFHPERSGRAGATILKNFVGLEA